MVSFMPLDCNGLEAGWNLLVKREPLAPDKNRMLFVKSMANHFRSARVKMWAIHFFDMSNVTEIYPFRETCIKNWLARS
jgi:hypothetical protein